LSTIFSVIKIILDTLVCKVYTLNMMNDKPKDHMMRISSWAYWNLKRWAKKRRRTMKAEIDMFIQERLDRERGY